MEAIRDAKMKFIQTGRLNRKLIRDEIALSWYKCQLNHLSTQKFRSVEIEKSKLQYLDQIVPESYDYYLADCQLKTLQQRTTKFSSGTWESLQEHEIGTNAASLSLKYEKIFYVKNEEHYLDCFSKVNTLGIPIKHESQVIGVLMLVSDQDITPHDYQTFISKISQDELLSLSMSNPAQKKYSLESSLFLTETLKENIEFLMKDLLEMLKPILIYGQSKTGKSTLAWEIYSQSKIIPYVFNCKDIPWKVQEHMVKDILQLQDYIIVEGIEYASEKVQSIFTAAIDRNFNVKDHLTGFIFICECGNLSELKKTLSPKLYERLNKFSVHLPCYSQVQMNEKSILLEVLIKQYDIECSKIEQNSILEITHFDSTKDLLSWIEALSKSCKPFTKSDLIRCKTSGLLSLSEYEGSYILDVFHRADENITLTCELLKISRSTFYRKFEKIQNKTNDLK